MYSRIISRPGWIIPEDKLKQYDDNIRRYAEKIKKNWNRQFFLKYYQYFALLFAEIYFDSYFQNPIKFLNELNKWLSDINREEYLFGRSDLQKIAYWMATGSGKTIIMHVNYWQFLAYNKGSKALYFDNIILVTPNDKMSQRHVEDLTESGIPAILFQGGSGRYFRGDKSTIKVISIHKLKLHEDNKGSGITIDVSELGTKNIVFVDEGHKGHKSKDLKWKKTRDQLAKDGFTIEYSATFGQAISSEKEIFFREYAKAILFDYSYKYFYSDGYGKDFYILNLNSKQFIDSQVPTLLLANTMSFYEQILVHQDIGGEIKKYQIAKPLWVFVGSRVKGERADILKVVQFFSWLLREDETIIKKRIEDILIGKSGIITGDRDVFAPQFNERNFTFFRENRISPDDIYTGIFKTVFHISPRIMGKKLHLINLKGSKGEIGLKVGASDTYFGLIYIGDTSGFLKLVKNQATDIAVENAVISKSLFEDIDADISTLNILIGAKKFIEGWNAWRVSNMCLLNIGKREGSQIIQLFGRGVRLKGKNFSLKRSSATTPPHPHYINVLETLNIFSVKANYMEVFKEIIEKEEMPSYELEPLRIEVIKPFPDDLQIFGLKKGWSFDQEFIRLELDDKITARIDLLPRAKIIDSREDTSLIATTGQAPQIFKKEVLDLLNWDDIYHTILDYKNSRELFNLLIEKSTLRTILYEKKYILLCNEELIEPRTFEAMKNVKEVIVFILKKYVDRFYAQKRNASEKTKLELKTLKPDDRNFPEYYSIKVNEENKALIDYIEKLIESKEIYTSGKEVKLLGDIRTYTVEKPITFKNAYLKGNLYQPLLIREKYHNITTIPTGLNEGEAKFIQDLYMYLEENDLPVEKVYVLRNLTRSRGVGFYETHSFYPDFIMWIKKNGKQIIVFIDPKGLTRLGLDDPKLKLHEYLRNEIQKELKDPNVKLDAFIVSVTSYTEVNQLYKISLSIEEYAQQKHVLFQKYDRGILNTSYIETLFNVAMMDT